MVQNTIIFYLTIEFNKMLCYHTYIILKGRVNMNITDIKIRLSTKPDSKLKAVAAITIDGCFVVHDIKVVEGQETVFIAMPSKKAPDGTYKDIAHPLNRETRTMIEEAILAAYKQALEANA